MKNKFVLKVLCLALFGCIFIFVSSARAEEAAQKFILDNGMTVVIKPMPSSPVIAVDALVKTGAATEGKYLGCGISHFIEHMLFKGTKRRGVGQVSQEVRALGGVINASTGLDYTQYTLELPKDRFEQGLDIISDMLMNSAFDPVQVEKEREVILGEMRMQNDNPNNKFSKYIFATVYTRHPYKHPVIGYEPLFKQINREGLLEYYHTHYIPNNIIVSIAGGGINTQDALEKVKEVFKSFEPKPYTLRNLPAEPSQIGSRESTQEYTTQLTRLAFAFQGVAFADSDVFALDVLAMILGQGESSRLYREVFKKQGLVYFISADNFTPVDRGLFEISCILDEKNLSKAIESIRMQIAEIKQKNITAEELSRAKRQVLSQYIFDHQAAGDVAGIMLSDEAVVGDFNFYQTYVGRIKEVTAADIKRVANKYLTENTLSIVVLKPKAEGKREAQQAGALEEQPIKKIQLDNGLTLLLKEDHAFPLVSVRLGLLGGLRQETESNNGIGNLMANLWTRGTSSRTAEKIAKETEDLGMGLGTFSGKNSFGINLDALSEDTDKALGLLEDLIKNPVFSEEELTKEKERIKSGILERDDDISSATIKALREKLFLSHPYRFDILGSKETVEAVSREDILKLYKRLAVSNNMVLAVFGDFDSEKILPLLKSKFSTLARANIFFDVPKEPVPQQPREEVRNMDRDQAVVMFGFQGPGIASEDIYGVDVFTSLLGSSLSGRMFVKIRDELGRSYRLGGSFTPGIDVGVISFYVATTDSAVDKVKQILADQIQEIQTNEISDEELNNTKAYLKGTHRMGLETAGSLATATVFDELYGLGYDHYRHYDEAIDRVTKADILRLARRYLNLNQAAIVITRPPAKPKDDSPTVSK